MRKLNLFSLANLKHVINDRETAAISILGRALCALLLMKMSHWKIIERC